MKEVIETLLKGQKTIEENIKTYRYDVIMDKKEATTLYNCIDKTIKENERLHNIIKETREYLEIFTSFDECTINGRMLQKAIDILDKENKE